jgi:pimeloyl-ACP methyl ester carboxylesterase
MQAKSILAVAGTAASLGAGVIAQRSLIARRRRNDPEGAERYGTRRGERSRYVRLPDGARLFIEEVGPESRSAAVFIHGSALRTDLWHHQLTGLGRHRLVFYDLRGHGLSQPKGDAQFSIKTLAHDVAAVVDELELDEVVLIGHSIGGMISLQACSDRPELLGDKVRGMVLLNTTHRPAAETLIGGAALAKIERVTRRPLDVLGSRPDYVDRLRRIIKPSSNLFMAVSFAAFGPGASAKQIDFTYDMLADTPADVIFDLLKSYRDFDVSELLPDIDVPTIVVGGTHDRITVAKASQHIAERLPRSELVLLEGCGHMSMLERHRELNKLLERFLDESLTATRPEGAVRL